MEPALDRLTQKRAWMASACLMVVFSLLSFRLIILQVVQHEAAVEEVVKYHVREEPLMAKRGTILDRNREPLACSQTVYTFYADLKHLQDLNLACYGLAVAEGKTLREVRQTVARDEMTQRYLERVVDVVHAPLGMDREELKAKLAGKTNGIAWLEKNVEEDRYRELSTLLEDAGVQGLHFRKESRRFYPSPRRLTHVLGYINHKNEGVEGIERSMDEALEGEDGYRFVEHDNRDREVAPWRREEVLPEDGDNVRLTIDMGIQNIVERVMDLGWVRFNPEKASAIFMDPMTGEILAMVNRPHFDLNTREGNRRNWSIMDQYEPGSTFKIVAMGAALDQRKVRLSTRVFCHHGVFNEDGLVLKDHSSYSDLSVKEVLAKSSNIGTYKVAKQVGPRKFHDYMLRYGFGEPTGIRLTGETGGRIHAPENWSRPSFSSMSMGYEVGVTPLQMLMAMSVVANGGELLKPRVVKAVEDAEGNVLESFDREVVRRVLSPAAASELRRALTDVVGPNGTGELATVPGFKVAGKTGTAQKYLTKEKRYADGRYVVSFQGFLPADNPRLVGIVVVDDPRSDDMKLYGGTVAAPLFAEMAMQIASYLDIQPEPDPLDLADLRPLQP